MTYVLFVVDVVWLMIFHRLGHFSPPRLLFTALVNYFSPVALAPQLQKLRAATSTWQIEWVSMFHYTDLFVIAVHKITKAQHKV